MLNTAKCAVKQSKKTFKMFVLNNEKCVKNICVTHFLIIFYIRSSQLVISGYFYKNPSACNSRSDHGVPPETVEEIHALTQEQIFKVDRIERNKLCYLDNAKLNYGDIYNKEDKHILKYVQNKFTRK